METSGLVTAPTSDEALNVARDGNARQDKCDDIAAQVVAGKDTSSHTSGSHSRGTLRWWWALPSRPRRWKERLPFERRVAERIDVDSAGISGFEGPLSVGAAPVVCIDLTVESDAKDDGSHRVVIDLTVESEAKDDSSHRDVIDLTCDSDLGTSTSRSHPTIIDLTADDDNDSSHL